MDPILALSLLVMALVLWTFIPQGQRHALSAGFGPAVHAVAEAVRAIVRPLLRLSYRLLCGVFGIEPAPWAVKDNGSGGAVFTSSSADNDTPQYGRYEADTVPGSARVSADTDAVRASTSDRTGTDVVRDGMVPLSRRLKPAEILAILAVQKDEKGEYRYSANAIAALMGGTRAPVLDQIKAIRGVAATTPADPIHEVTPEGKIIRTSAVHRH